MTLKFDSKCLIEGKETLCHVDGNNIKIGAPGGKGQLSYNKIFYFWCFFIFFKFYVFFH